MKVDLQKRELTGLTQEQAESTILWKHSSVAYPVYNEKCSEKEKILKAKLRKSPLQWLIESKHLNAREKNPVFI